MSMKAFLFVTYFLISNPGTLLTTTTVFESRNVCEIQEGMMNNPFTYYRDLGLTDTTEMYGEKWGFVMAECMDSLEDG